LGGTFDEDVDAVARTRARRLTLTPFWTINKQAILNLNYSILEMVGNRSATAKSFFVTLTLRL
jgi:hypothetical protein